MRGNASEHRPVADVPKLASVAASPRGESPDRLPPGYPVLSQAPGKLAKPELSPASSAASASSVEGAGANIALMAGVIAVGWQRCLGGTGGERFRVAYLQQMR